MNDVTTTTEDVTVVVHPFPLAQESDADAGRFAFGYRVTIANNSAQAIHLDMRYWVIIDGNGERREIRGPGVVGKQPTIQPGETYTYSNGAQLPTAWGTMEGGYGFTREDGSHFPAYIDRFYLVSDQVAA